MRLDTLPKAIAPSLPPLPVVVLLYLLCVTLPIGFYLGPLYLTTLRLLLLVTTLPLLVQLFMGRYGRLVASDWLFLCHALWICVALAINNPSQVIQQAPSVGVEFLGGYLVARAYIRTPDVFLATARWIVFLVLCSLPFSIVEALTGTPVLLKILDAVPSVAVPADLSIDIRLGLERVQSSFAHPIHYGLFCSIAFSMAFVALQGFYSAKRRIVTAGLVAFSGFLALSSGALLAIFLQMALILWAMALPRFNGRWWLLMGVFALAYVAIDLMSNRSPMQVFMSYATFSAHNAYWRGIIFEWGIMNVFGNAAEKIPASPWVGIGLNDWTRPHYMHSSSVDNFWLMIGMRYGLPGFLFLALGWLSGLFRIMARPFRQDSTVWRIRRAFAFTFIGLTLTLVTVHVWTNIYSFVFFIFGAGIWMITYVETAPATAPSDATRTPQRRATPPRTRGEPVFTRFAPGTAPSHGTRARS